jgi:hypothetical protein
MKFEYKEKVLNSIEGVNKRVDMLDKASRGDIFLTPAEVMNLVKEIKRLMDVIEGIVDIS